MADLWGLDQFDERLEAWIAQERPPEWLQSHLWEWIPTRKLDPIAGARREAEFDNLWTIQVPGTSDGHRAVVCSFWVYYRTRSARCDNFGWLSLPII